MKGLSYEKLDIENSRDRYSFCADRHLRPLPIDLHALHLHHPGGRRRHQHPGCAGHGREVFGFDRRSSGPTTNKERTNPLFVASEFVEVTKLTPLRYDEVAVFVNRSAVRRVADAVLPLVR